MRRFHRKTYAVCALNKTGLLFKQKNCNGFLLLFFFRPKQEQVCNCLFCLASDDWVASSNNLSDAGSRSYKVFNWCRFARAKKLFRRTYCDSIAELKQVFDHSSSTNKGVLFDNGENSFTWKYYNWKDFLSQFFTALPGISKYHSFRFNAEHPGFVFVKENINSQEMKIQILKPFGLQHIPDNSPTEIAFNLF